MSEAEVKIPSVVTVVSAPDAAAVTEELLRDLSAGLYEPGPPEWLAGRIAADIPFLANPRDHARIAAELRGRAGRHPVDVVVQPAAGRRKRLFVADMDSTMIGQECIDEIADHAGMKPHIAAITERAMRGEIAFVPALRERVALLKGLSASVIETVIAERIRLTPGARTLVATMRAQGAYTCLVSGGFTAFTARIAAMIGFDAHHANTLVIEDGRLAGLVADPVLGREAKLAILRDLTARLAVAPAETLAVGDGANDIPMIEAAGLGVAYHAKPTVAAAAAACIDHGDLTALLYLQGYRRDDFAR